MKRPILSFLLAACLLLTLAPAAWAAPTAQDASPVRVEGVPVADPHLKIFDGVPFVALRAVSQALLPAAAIAWDGHRATVTLPGVVTLSAVPGEEYLTANGRCLYIPGGVRAERGSVLVPVSVLAQALDARCDLRRDGAVDLTRGSGGIRPASLFYDESALYWLSHIIYAESGNQPLAGQIAVGSVVLHRAAHPEFPDTIYGVIFQPGQFTPVANGAIYLTPSAQSVTAAKLCLEGAEVLPGALYFNRAGLNSWASRARPYIATIAQHTFYG